MSAIDKHVDVQISKETATVSRTGFGTPLLLVRHLRFPELYRVYGSLTELTDDGFTTTGIPYRMASAIWAQSPRPTQIVMGRRDTPVIRDVKLTPKAPVLASTAYTLTINDEVFTFTSDATPTVAEITAGLETLINAGAADVTATDNTTDLDVEKADTPGGTPTAGPPFRIEFDPSLWTFKDNTADAAVDTDLANLLAVYTDFYGIATDLLDATNINDLATAVESASVPLIYAADSQDSDIVTSSTSDIASTLQTAAFDRTFLNYTPDADPSMSCGFLGKQLPSDPGSTTWKFKTLSTISAASLTTGEIVFADNKSANTYTTVGGINITAEGVMASGEFIDVTRFIDWLEARIKENVFRALAINEKIPYTDSGIQAIVAEIEGVLRQGVFNGGINGDEDLIVTAPRAADVSANDRASRLLPNIEFLASLAGAIHKTVIRGKVVA
jgi:hypothetical protein